MNTRRTTLFSIIFCCFLFFCCCHRIFFSFFCFNDSNRLNTQFTFVLLKRQLKRFRKIFLLLLLFYVILLTEPIILEMGNSHCFHQMKKKMTHFFYSVKQRFWTCVCTASLRFDYIIFYDVKLLCHRFKKKKKEKIFVTFVSRPVVDGFLSWSNVIQLWIKTLLSCDWDEKNKPLALHYLLKQTKETADFYKELRLCCCVLLAVHLLFGTVLFSASFCFDRVSDYRRILSLVLELIIRSFCVMIMQKKKLL